MKKSIAEHPWLTVYQAPAKRVPQPTKEVWPLARRELANFAFADLTQLNHVIRQRLRVTQRKPGLIYARLAPASPVPNRRDDITL